MSSTSLRRSRKILFLDRDDTIIKDFGYLNDPDRVILLDGVIDALKLFRDEGYEFIVTTNQSGLTRGRVLYKNLNLIHQKIQTEFNKYGIRFLDFYSAPYCHEHRRRKPGPGLTEEAISDYNIDLQKSIFAGDKWRDLLVGYKLKGKTILVNEASHQRELFNKSFTPDLCLPQWTDLTPSIFKAFLQGESINLSLEPFKNLSDSSLTSKKQHLKNNLDFKNK